MKASFSLEAVSVATCQHGVSPAWYMIARRGLGRRGQVLNWIGAKRYEALRRKGRWEKAGQSSEAQAALYRVLLHRATFKTFPGERRICRWYFDLA
jgi:hypothetical protein